MNEWAQNGWMEVGAEKRFAAESRSSQIERHEQTGRGASHTNILPRGARPSLCTTRLILTNRLARAVANII